MKAKIAVATVSGKAYYLLVNELKKRNLSFLSLTPDDPIPIDVRVVITTKEERQKIAHENVLEHREDKNPAEVIDEAVRMIKGKRTYERVIVGVDPGYNLGVAVLGDGDILETKNCTSLREAAKKIEEVLNRTPATHVTIRIGSGVPSYAEQLWQILNNTVSADVFFESVSEEGTSQPLGETSHRRGKKDVNSAIEIAQRKGRLLPRRNRQ